MKTMICLVLDRSGSMGGREADVVGGVNAFLEEQKKLPDPASIAMVRFDTQGIERFRKMVPLADCAPLTPAEFQPRGGTPLLDAVGKTVAQLDDDWKSERPERCIVVIVTDGQENESCEYTKEKVKALIKAREDSGMWAFIYLGADVNTFTDAASLGINARNTATYTNSAVGTRSLYAAASDSVGSMRATGKTVAPNLGGVIAEDAAAGIPPVGWTPPPVFPATPSTAWTPPA